MYIIGKCYIYNNYLASYFVEIGNRIVSRVYLPLTASRWRRGPKKEGEGSSWREGTGEKAREKKAGKGR